MAIDRKAWSGATCIHAQHVHVHTEETTILYIGNTPRGTAQKQIQIHRDKSPGAHNQCKLTGEEKLVPDVVRRPAFKGGNAASCFAITAGNWPSLSNATGKLEVTTGTATRPP